MPALVLLFIAACIDFPEPVTLAPITDATEMRLRGRRSPGGVITDPERTDAILEFINARREGWGSPWYGIPVPPIAIQIRAGSQFVETFGVGDSYFQTQMLTRDASDAEIEEFLRLIGVSREARDD